MISRRPTNRFIPPMPTVPTIFFDLETLPTDDPVVIARIADGIQAPANYSKADSIKAWERSSKPALVDEAVRKTSFDGTYGRICCIGWAFNDQRVHSRCGQEAEVIQAFFDAVGKWDEIPIVGAVTHVNATVVGHNIRSFDMRFLWQRSVILGLFRPKSLPWHVSKWDERVQDTMTLWNPDTARRVSLDKLCHALGVRSPKDGFDGSMVADAWALGQREKIALYCEGDVDAVRQCWWKMQG